MAKLQPPPVSGMPEGMPMPSGMPGVPDEAINADELKDHISGLPPGMNMEELMKNIPPEKLEEFQNKMNQMAKSQTETKNEENTQEETSIEDID